MSRLVIAAMFASTVVASGCAKQPSFRGTAGQFGQPSAPTRASGRASAEEAAAPVTADFDAGADEIASEAPSRLGTEYGEQHVSHSRNVRFERAPGGPQAVLTLRYDDVDNVRQLAANMPHFHATGATVSSTDGRLSMSLLDDHGQLLPGGDNGEERFAVGRAGIRYRLGIENETDERYEVVASVDGLDVIDGSDASLQHRGYVVDAFTSMVIDGWRTSDDSVAAFRFSELDDSYAGRTGRARNVGVVGAAFFPEALPAFDPPHRRARGSDGGRFAPPPPPRQQSPGWW